MLLVVTCCTLQTTHTLGKFLPHSLGLKITAVHECRVKNKQICIQSYNRGWVAHTRTHAYCMNVHTRGRNQIPVKCNMLLVSVKYIEWMVHESVTSNLEHNTCAEGNQKDIMETPGIYKLNIFKVIML